MNSKDYKIIYERLAGEESKTCFAARESCLKSPSLSRFYSILRKTGVSFRFRDLDNYSKAETFTGWVLPGKSNDKSNYHRMVLMDAGFVVKGPGISNAECVDLVANQGFYVLSVVGEPVPKEISAGRICYVENHLVGRCGWQYFDYFQPRRGECFLDGGGLDGNTTKQFLKWCGGDFEHIYVFEPSPLEKKNCQNNLKEMSCPGIHFHNKALWNKNESLPFKAHAHSKWDSRIDEKGQYMVMGSAADSVLGNCKITFLKLDVEGAEEKALQGAEKLILDNRPRMAISIYHGLQDFIRIPLYLLSLIPDYRFAIRHYHSDLIETILYVF